MDLDVFAQLPEGTLGREYARFLRANNLTPDVFQAPPNVSWPEFSYFA